MKKFLLLLSLSVATLFASPAYVYYVGSLIDTAGNYGYEDVSGNYGLATLLEPRPSPSTGYMLPTTVYYAQTAYIHNNGDRLHIYVYYPVSQTNDAVFIDKRNEYEWKNGLNGTSIQGYAISPYKFDEIPLSDGSKLIGYEFTDLSGYDKRITVTTCPNKQLPTQVDCNFAVIDIAGIRHYNK